MHPRAADQKQRALLAHPARLAIGQRQRLAQGIGLAGARDDVERLLRACRIGAPVEDQLAFGRREAAQLQPAVGAAEKGVVLRDRRRALLGPRRDGCRERVDAVNARLDFDVAGHAGGALLVPGVSASASR